MRSLGTRRFVCKRDMLATSGIERYLLAGRVLAETTRKERSVVMRTKEAAIQSIRELPEDATWEDIQERVNFMAGVRRGLHELDEGKGIAHDRVREDFSEWLIDYGMRQEECRSYDRPTRTAEQPGV